MLEPVLDRPLTVDAAWVFWNMASAVSHVFVVMCRLCCCSDARHKQPDVGWYAAPAIGGGGGPDSGPQRDH